MGNLEKKNASAKKSDPAKNLNTASGVIFFLGILCSKLSYFPIALVSGIGYLLSLTLYLIGYLLWILASYFYPEYPRLESHWSGFVQFKEQSKVSACVGGIAVIFAFLTFIYPWAVIPSIWLFFFSNLVWSISHYHQLKNPSPDADQHSKENQGTFLNYTIANTAISFITAVCLTLSFFCPPVAPILLMISTGFGLALTIASMCYFLHYHVSMYRSTRKTGKNYSDISEGLSKLPSAGISAPPNPEPTPIIDAGSSVLKGNATTYTLPVFSTTEKKAPSNASSLSSLGLSVRAQVFPEVDNPEPGGYNPGFS